MLTGAYLATAIAFPPTCSDVLGDGVTGEEQKEDREHLSPPEASLSSTSLLLTGHRGLFLLTARETLSGRPLPQGGRFLEAQGVIPD